MVDARGANMVVGDLIYQGSAVLVRLNNDLPKGTYTVKYQVDRKKDGQPEGGAYQFAYGKGNWTSVVSSWSGTRAALRWPTPIRWPTARWRSPVTTPPVVEVNNGPTATASPTPTRTSASPKSTPTASETPTGRETPAATDTPTPSRSAGGGADPLPWIVGAVVLVSRVPAAG